MKFIVYLDLSFISIGNINFYLLLHEELGFKSSFHCCNYGLGNINHLIRNDAKRFFLIYEGSQYVHSHQGCERINTSTISAMAQYTVGYHFHHNADHIV